MAAPVGLFSLSSSDSDSEDEPQQQQQQQQAPTPSAQPPPPTPVSLPPPPTATGVVGPSSVSAAAAHAVLADLTSSESDADATSSDDDEALIAPRQANRAKPPAQPTSAATAAAAATPVTPVPSSSASSSSAAAAGGTTITSGGFKFKLSLSSAKRPSEIHDARPPAAAPEPSVSSSRSKRTPAPKKPHAADELPDEDMPAAATSGKRKRAASHGASSKKRSKKSGGVAPAPPVASGPIVVQQIVWLQCDDPMCAKWRSMRVAQFDDQELTFTGDIARPTDEHAKALKAHGPPPALPMPTFLSQHPLTLDDLSRMTFYCWQNPNLAYARCSAEEEKTESNEIVVETS